jgi:hypothetical protein
MIKGVIRPRSAPKVKVSNLDYAKIQRAKTQGQKSATGTAKNGRAKGAKTSGRIKGATEERSGFE